MDDTQESVLGWDMKLGIPYINESKGSGGIQKQGRGLGNVHRVPPNSFVYTVGFGHFPFFVRQENKREFRFLLGDPLVYVFCALARSNSYGDFSLG